FDMMKEVEQKAGAVAPPEPDKLTPGTRRSPSSSPRACAARSQPRRPPAPPIRPVDHAGRDRRRGQRWGEVRGTAARRFREFCRALLFARLIISVPPRHLKSHLASVTFPAWSLGHDPSMQILYVSYA